MAIPVITNDGKISAVRYHLNISLASEAGVTDVPTDYKVTTVNTWLSEGVYLANVLSGSGVTSADGTSIQNTLGQTNLLDKSNTGTYTIYGLTPVDSKAIFDYFNNQTCHVATLIAPASRQDSDKQGITALEGDNIVIYSDVQIRVKEQPAVDGAQKSVLIDFTQSLGSDDRDVTADELIIADL